MANFYKRLSYSFGNEDWNTEQQALQIEPENKVLCITASGDRPLHLLMNDCSEVIAVDANPIQNHLLHLKSAAMQALDYDHYLAFLGMKPSKNRQELLRKLLPHMEPTSAHHWLKHENTVSKGVIYRGATERWAYRVSLIFRMMRHKEIHTLFTFNDLHQQQIFIRKKWNHKFWKNVFKIGLNPWITRVFFKDPGTYAHFDRSIEPGNYIYERMMTCLESCLAKENPLISIIFKGEVGKDAYPPYLLPSEVNLIKKRLNRLKIKTADVIKYLENVPEKSIDRFSLSDVASYMDHESYVRMMRALYKAARPGARFCMRQFMSRYKIPANLEPCFKLDQKLAHQLEKEDRAFVYHFTIGSVIKN